MDVTLAQIETMLPDGFADLESFAAPWSSLATPEARYLQRQSSTIEGLRGFYEAMKYRVSDIFAYLDRFPMDEALPASAERLFRMALGLVEVIQAVEVFAQPRVPYAAYPDYISMQWHEAPPGRQ